MSAGWLIHEDPRIFVLNKPAGIATHTPEPATAWGLQDYLAWLHPDKPRPLIVHRLDRDTSGVLVFARTQEACRELSAQLEKEQVAKRYVFLSARKPARDEWHCDQSVEGKRALTEFRLAGKQGAFHRIEARPKTGRTHQVRAHAAFSGVPVAGDREHGNAGDPWPLLLHAAEMRCRAPGSQNELRFEAPEPATFSAATPQEAHWARAGLLRGALLPSSGAMRLIHGAADGFAGQVVERYGERWVLSEFGGSDPWLRQKIGSLQGVRKTFLGEGRVEVDGGAAPVIVEEGGLKFEIRFDESTTAGLFLDQRENRLKLKRILETAPEAGVLNLYAHTCSFSAVAAAAGREAASVDLSAKYLEWGRRNFSLNGLNPEDHRWLRGDAEEWIKRLGKKNEKFAVIILDPPSFSRGKKADFRVERDLVRVVREAAELLLPGGWMLVATNLKKWNNARFLEKVREGLGKRKLALEQIALPPDFPHAAAEPLWMKSAWIKLY